MREVKKSIYNITAKQDNNYILYNTRSCSMIKLNKEYFDIFNTLDLTKSEAIEQFYKLGFLVDKSTDELRLILEQYNSYKGDSSKLFLTIAPTINCNFGCEYCFESNKINKNMSNKTIDRIISYIKDREKIKEIKVVWYGGEPTLQIKNILYFNKLRDKYLSNRSISQTIITNGFLLNRKNALLLRNSGISNAQITIDGPKVIHDKRRFLKNKKGSFDTIINNIIDIKNIINIDIRINVDENNINFIDDLLDVFIENGFNDKVNVYLAPVVYENGIAKKTCGEQVFTIKSNKYLQFYKKAVEHCLTKRVIPLPLPSYCTAILPQAFLITPSGKFGKCWEDVVSIENGKISPNIFENDLINNKLVDNWSSYIPPYDNKCKTCNLFPICLGGCPKAVMRNNKSDCIALKNNVEEYVKLLAMQLQRRL